MNSGLTHSPPRSNAALYLGVVIVSLFLLLCLNVKTNLEVDENVFVTSGVLLNKGLLPYRDYQYNHMPTLVLIYGLLLRSSSYLLLTARCFSMLCATAAVTLMFAVALRAFSPLTRRAQLIYAVGIALLFLANPLFDYTAGLAWNHDFPVLCCLIGFLLIRHTMMKGGRITCAIVAGICLGLAITSRLTFAPTLLPFTLFVGCYPGLSRKRRAQCLAALALGVIIASLPSAWVCLQAPREAWFGNLIYPSLNTEYHLAHNFSGHRPFTIAARLWFLVTICFSMPGNGVLIALFGWLMIGGLRSREWLRDPQRFELAILLLMVAVLTAAGFAASPLYKQYLYDATPFLILGTLRALAAVPGLQDNLRVRRFFIGAVAIAVVCSIPQFNGVLLLGSFHDWGAVQVHDVGQTIAARTAPGAVLTLEPIYALEAGRGIYPELATGRFSVRGGQYLSPALQRQHKMSSPDGLYILLTQKHPVGVFLTGTDIELEPPMEHDAAALGYAPLPLPPFGTLWIRPGH